MPETKFTLKKKRIRAYLLSLQADRGKKEGLEEDFYEKGLVYIQMRLPVEKITQEFEDSLKETIEKKIIRAKIREGTEEDLETVMEVYNKSWLTSNTPFRPITFKSLKTIYDDPDTVFFIAKVHGVDAGFVILDYEGENNQYGVIAGLGILPRFQRKGLGTVLGMASWDYFKKKGVEELRCEVYKDNNASSSFIRDLGFEEYGIPKVYKLEDFDLEGD